MLKEKISEHLKSAQKERDEIAVSILRMLLSEIHNKEIQKKQALTDPEVLKVLAGEKKKHFDSIAQFKTGGREDLVTREEQELAILAKYLPEELGDAELRQLINQAVAEAGETDFGKAMKAVMPKVAGRADGARVSAILKEVLAG